MRNWIWLPVMLSLLPTVASAQIGKETELWKWSSKAKHHNAIVQVSMENGTGTGVIIHADRSKPVAKGHQGYCLTAYHVVEDDDGERNIRVTYRDGQVSARCKVVAFDKKNDVAILWVWVPTSVQPARVAMKNIVAREQVEYAGLGGGSSLKCCLRHFTANASITTTNDKIFADAALLPGDSGGPVFNKRGEVVGVISGGWFWFDGGVRVKNGGSIQTTWPARSTNVAAVRKLMTEVPGLKMPMPQFAKADAGTVVTKVSK